MSYETVSDYQLNFKTTNSKFTFEVLFPSFYVNKVTVSRNSSENYVIAYLPQHEARIQFCEIQYELQLYFCCLVLEVLQCQVVYASLYRWSFSLHC